MTIPLDDRGSIKIPGVVVHIYDFNEQINKCPSCSSWVNWERHCRAVPMEFHIIH